MRGGSEMTNPTVFAIGPDDATNIIWLVDNPEPIEVYTHKGRQLIQSPAQKMLDLIKQTIGRHGKIFASYYRPGAFWEEEVFVCPRCKHATLIGFAEGVGPDQKTVELSEWYCKYCYTSWACSSERGVFPVEIEYDD